MDVNRIAVGLITAAAAIYLFTKIRASYTGRKCGCDQGCSRDKSSTNQPDLDTGIQGNDRNESSSR
jgi:hypothetical protein